MPSQNYSAKSAQRIVGRFVADEISYLLRAGEPDLVVSKRLYWRVPVQLASPDRGIVGAVGTIDVDFETGQIVVTPKGLAQIAAQARRLAD